MPARKAAPKHNPLWQSLAMRSGVLQPKLTIGQADDQYEREADRAADQVLRMPAPHSDGHGLSITPVTAHQAQRKCVECEEEEEGALQRKESAHAEAPVTAPPIVHQTLSSPGQPLDAETRAYFEPRFGHDFSRVRIHTGGDAVSATHAVRAHAFTLGDRIAFSAGQYAPRSETGRRLLAHELTHVAQQRRGAPRVIQRAETDDNPEFCFPTGDQSSPLPDISSEIDGWIEEVAEGRSGLAVAQAIFEGLGMGAVTTQVEDRIAALPEGRVRHVRYEESRYRVPDWVLKFYRSQGREPISPVSNVADVCIGADKLGHFFQQGYEYFKIDEAIRDRIRSLTPLELDDFLARVMPDLRNATDEDVIADAYTGMYGAWLEGFPGGLPPEEIDWIRKKQLMPSHYQEGIYGRTSSGVLSPADLEANRQGGRFYGDVMRTGRARSIAGYVNSDWNEYANPNSFVGGSYFKFRPRSGPEAPAPDDDPHGGGPNLSPIEPGAFTKVIPFETESDFPDSAAMDKLVIELWSRTSAIRQGRYKMSIVGHASRTGSEGFNLDLSQRRAEIVRNRLEFLLGLELEDDYVKVKWKGESKAVKDGKPESDDSPEYRVAQVIFTPL